MLPYTCCSYRPSMVVAEHDACASDDDKGTLLRREGAYSSHVGGEWALDATAAGTAALDMAGKRLEDNLPRGFRAFGQIGGHFGLAMRARS